jgi:hypothetical protein
VSRQQAVPARLVQQAQAQLLDLGSSTAHDKLLVPASCQAVACHIVQHYAGRQCSVQVTCRTYAPCRKVVQQLPEGESELAGPHSMSPVQQLGSAAPCLLLLCYMAPLLFVIQVHAGYHNVVCFVLVMPACICCWVRG